MDSCAQISAITSECANRLGLARRKYHTEIVGLGQSPVTQVKGRTTCSFVPRHTMDPVFSCSDLIILPQITSFMPANCLPTSVRTEYHHLQLADPRFDEPAHIDMLIGCDVFPFLVRPQSGIIHTIGLPSALETYLGWILVGTVDQSANCSTSSTALSLTVNPSLDTLLHRFWSIEEPPAPSKPTTEDELCEKWFTQTVSRDA